MCYHICHISMWVVGLLLVSFTSQVSLFFSLAVSFVHTIHCLWVYVTALRVVAHKGSTNFLYFPFMLIFVVRKYL